MKRQVGFQFASSSLFPPEKERRRLMGENSSLSLPSDPPQTNLKSRIGEPRPDRLQPEHSPYISDKHSSFFYDMLLIF
jgi:hypothetical protein